MKPTTTLAALGKGGKVTQFVDGKPAGQGDLPMTQAGTTVIQRTN